MSPLGIHREHPAGAPPDATGTPGESWRACELARAVVGSVVSRVEYRLLAEDMHAGLRMLLVLNNDATAGHLIEVATDSSRCAITAHRRGSS